MLVSLPQSARSSCREARGPRPAPLLLHLQKNRNSTFSPLSNKEQVAPERFSPWNKNSGVKRGKMQNCYRDRGGEGQITGESFRQNELNLSEAEAFALRCSISPPTEGEEGSDQMAFTIAHPATASVTSSKDHVPGGTAQLHAARAGGPVGRPLALSGGQPSRAQASSYPALWGHCPLVQLKCFRHRKHL